MIYEKIEGYLPSTTKRKVNFGLMRGLMGECLYLYCLSRVSGNDQYEAKADDLLDSIYENLPKTLENSCDFENGLAGIGWGIEFLVQNEYLEADTNEVLADIDDKVFLFLAHGVELSNLMKNGLIGYGFYLVKRLQNPANIKNQSPKIELLRDLLFKLLVMISEKLYKGKFRFKELPFFELDWELPLLCILLSEVYDLGIGHAKIIRIMEYVQMQTKDLLPSLNANRLYLNIALKRINSRVPLSGINQKIVGLNGLVDESAILQNEFKDQNVSLDSGFAALLFILAHFNESDNQESQYATFDECLYEKILNSTFWDRSVPFDHKKESVYYTSSVGVGLACLPVEMKIMGGVNI